MSTKEKLDLLWKYLALIVIAILGLRFTENINSEYISNNDDIVVFGDNVPTLNDNNLNVEVKKEIIDGDTVMSIDADICVFDITKPFVTKKSFGYAIDSCNTHCMGAYTININEWSRKMINNMLDQEMYLRLKDTPIWKMWNDQAAWYTIAGIKRHSWIPFRELENNGWHSNPNSDVKYSISDLEKHVELLPVEWNVTHVAGEGFNEYFINPSHRKDTIFRHFAGGPAWDEKYFLESEEA